MTGFSLSKVLKISALLLFCTSCAITQSTETVTLKFEEIEQSFHRYEATYLGLVQRIDNNMRVTYGRNRTIAVHSYKEVSTSPDGLRVSSKPILRDVSSAGVESSISEFEKNFLAVKEAILTFKGSRPDIIIDSTGNFLRYEITNEYKQQTMKLSKELLAYFGKEMGNHFPLTKPLLSIIKKRLENIENLTDKDFWPKDGPQWFNLSSLDGVTLYTSGKAVSGVQLKSDGNKGSLSFVKYTQCDNTQKSNSCVLLKFVPEQKSTVSKNESVTYLLVEPNTLIPYRVETGNRFNTKPGNKRSSDRLSINVIYRTYADISETATEPDVAELAERLFDLVSGKKATLEDFHTEYKPLLRSLKHSLSFCKLEYMKDNDNCKKIQIFYTDESQMRVVSHMEDLAEKSKNPLEIKRLLNRLNSVMEKRPMFLAAVKLAEAKKSAAMDMDAQEKLMARYVIETLESSPVNSRRHQEYSKKVIEAMKLVMEGASMSELKIRR